MIGLKLQNALLESVLIGTGITGSLFASLLSDLNENAAAYGLIISLSIGLLGIIVHAIRGEINTRVTKRDALLSRIETERHNRATEARQIHPKPE